MVEFRILQILYNFFQIFEFGCGEFQNDILCVRTQSTAIGC